jgi:hypothetical protein
MALLKLYRGLAAPAAEVGKIWFDVTNDVIKVYNGTEWESYGTAPADLAALAARVNTLETVTIPGLEASLKALITAEETRATAKEAELAAAIETEKGRAEGIEAGLETRLAAVEADYLKAADKTELSDAIASEKTRAEGKEAELLAAIEAEAATARAAEKANADAIAVEKGRLDTFLADADVTEKAVDTLKEIQTYINEHGEAAAKMVESIAANAAAIEAEVTRATTAEGNLQTAITNEVTAREAGDADTLAAAKKYTDDSIALLDATVGSQTVEEGKHVAVEVVETDGKLTGLTVVESDIASAAALATLDAEVQEHEQVVSAALNDLNARMTTAEGSVADHEARLAQAEADIDALEGALADKNVAAESTTPDYVTATAADNKVTVAATQKVIDAVALAETSVQTITSDNTCLTAVKTGNNVALSLVWENGSF